jgi:hypothetical protein
MPWGGTWEFNPMPITGNALFDYFFTLVMVFGLAALMIGLAVNVISKA